MHILGKVLLVFNALAAAGVGFLATQNWAKRQDITATALRYYLVIDGLPVEKPAGIDADDESVALGTITTGGNVVETVRPSLLKAYFQGTDGGQQFVAAPVEVKNQIEEVARVQGKVDAQLGAMDAPATRLAKLCGFTAGTKYTPGWLTGLAETYEERDAIRKLATAEPQNVQAAADKAQAILKGRFEVVKNKPDPAAAAAYGDRLKASAEKLRPAADIVDQKHKADVAAQAGMDEAAKATARKELLDAREALDKIQKEHIEVLADRHGSAAKDDADRRRQIAHLLLLLDPSKEWQKRVGMIVGLKVYQNAIADQAGRLQDIARGYLRVIELDQSRFIDLYEQLKNLALERSYLLDQQLEIVKGLDLQRATDVEALKARNDQLMYRKTEYAALRAKVEKKLLDQAKTEKDLFEVQKRVGETLRLNFKLEQDLDVAEQKKPGL